MELYYQKEARRLVFVNKAASSSYWDSLWDKEGLPTKPYNFNVSRFDLMVYVTRKYLPVGSKVLEGGCGLAKTVYKLSNAGFQCTGIDTAKKTVKLLNKTNPNLDVRLGDVTKIKCKDGEFDGYWSLGVIEHFYDGYGPAMKEMRRVVRKGGYVFITFPHMSSLRRLKAKNGAYPIWQGVKKKDFYQFALDERIVMNDLRKNGFKVVAKKRFDGTKGCKDEIKWLNKPLKKVYGAKNLFARVFVLVFSALFSWFGSHSILIVARRE